MECDYNFMRPSSALSSEQWQEERTLLMAMLEKSQRIALTSQSAFQNEKTELQDQQTRIEDSFKSQIMQLKKENTVLRSEMERLRKCSGCTGDLTLRTKLLQEIERLESAGGSKEKRLHTQILELTQKLNGEQQVTADVQRKHNDEIEFLKAQIEKLRRDTNVMNETHKREENNLQTNLERLQAQLTLSSTEIDRLKSAAHDREKLIQRLKHAPEDAWGNDQQSQAEETVKQVKLLQEKERLLEAQLKAILTDKDEALKHAYELNEQHMAEKQQLQDKLQTAVRLAGEREFALQKEVERLRRTNFYLMETTQTREASQLTESKGLRGNLEKLKTAYVEREKSHADEIRSLRQQVERLQTEPKVEVKNSPDVTARLRYELGILETQLADKADQLENMKEMYLSARTSERAQVTKAIQASQRTIEEFKKTQGTIQAVYAQLQSALRLTGQDDLESQRKLLADMKELIEENARMNLRLKETERLEKDNDAKRKDLELCRQELLAVSRDWKNCEAELKELEALIEKKPREDPTFTQTDLLLRTTLENRRLSDELLNLTEVRNRLEEFYLAEVKGLRAEIQTKARETDELKSQNSRLKSFRTKKSLEELTAWQVRQDALEKTIKALEVEIATLKASVSLQGQMGESIRNLEAEELKLLRKEVLEKEAWVAEMKQSWDEDKEEMRAELRRLRISGKETEGSLEQCYQALQVELTSLTKQKASLKKVEEERLRLLEYEQEALAHLSSQGTSDYKADPAAVIAAREEVEALKTQFANEKLSWNTELKEAKLMADSQLDSSRKVETILNRHIKAQQDQLQTMTQTLEEVRALHSQEIKALRQELATLRKVSGAHTQMLQNERKILSTQIERLVGLAGSRRDSTLTHSILEKVMKLQTDLAIVKGAYEKSIRLDPSNIEDVQKVETELAKLREIIEKGDILRREEKLEVTEAVATIKGAVQAVQSQALTERDMLVNEAEVLSKRLKLLQSDAELVRRQRDEALESLTKMKNLGKLERSEVVQLIDSLKTQERTRISQLQDEYMRLIQQIPRQQVSIKKKK